MLLSLIEAREPASYPGIYGALRRETREVLERSLPLAWIPIEIDVEVVERVAEHLGDANFELLIEQRQREEMKSALFSGFVKTALRLFGASMSLLIKRLPSGWAHLFRNVSRVEIVSTGPHEAVAHFRGLPRVCIESAPWMAALPVGLRMLYELILKKGTVECRIEDPAAGDARVTFRWT
jgi:hypothetical protein